MHRNADRFRTVIEEETSTLLREAERAEGHLEWERFHRAGWRITRRIILGDGAADDEELTKLLAELMAEANRLPKKRSERFEPFMARLGEHVSKAEPGSLVALFDEAPSDAETKVVGQVPHWLFALGDTLPANSFRALALIVTHPRQGARVDEELTAAEREGRLGTASGVAGLSYLDACLEEAMRLWPTTAILSRETLTETRWDGAPVPAGTQVLISNIFNHRDPASHEFADRFAPEAWLEAGARDDWSFNQFSHGPQGCPGTGIALFVGKGVLAGLMTQRRIRLMEPELDPVRPLPHMLDFHRLRFAVEPRS